MAPATGSGGVEKPPAKKRGFYVGSVDGNSHAGNHGKSYKERPMGAVPLRARVQAVLVEQLPLGEPSAEKVADALHLSLRSLQRKLAEEDSSYEALLDEARRELACSYLKDRKLSVSEITFLLGFSHPGSFTRAFKRWTGVAPSQFRESR